ncbi:hypothetical protein mRhiFer1_007805 [Rhinolophus ferrumequinum]|uniref:Uncharacterized protein n=1 Tax=Rhinolophus ferrumequinum TaxID=59479 RepID=A0A7J8AUY3_RHIFE|nr:hypothetical protein mRhiFer1_007805 [Rhinolophus ferrumequinum]
MHQRKTDMPDTGTLEEQDECVFLSLSVSSLNVFGLCSLKCVFPICMVLLLVSSLCLIFFFVHRVSFSFLFMRVVCALSLLSQTWLFFPFVSLRHIWVLCAHFLSCLPLFFSLCELIVCHSLPLFV